MKVQTETGEYELDEVVRCFNLWKQFLLRQNQKRTIKNQTEEGKVRNRTNAKSYYERNKELITEKRKAAYERNKEAILKKQREAYEAKKNTPQFQD